MICGKNQIWRGGTVGQSAHPVRICDTVASGFGFFKLIEGRPMRSSATNCPGLLRIPKPRRPIGCTTTDGKTAQTCRWPYYSTPQRSFSHCCRSLHARSQRSTEFTDSATKPSLLLSLEMAAFRSSPPKSNLGTLDQFLMLRCLPSITHTPISR